MLHTTEIYVLWRTATLGVQNPPYRTPELLGRAHIETQADATQGRPGHGDAVREALRDTV